MKMRGALECVGHWDFALIKHAIYWLKACIHSPRNKLASQLAPVYIICSLPWWYWTIQLKCHRNVGFQFQLQLSQKILCIHCNSPFLPLKRHQSTLIVATMLHHILSGIVWLCNYFYTDHSGCSTTLLMCTQEYSYSILSLNDSYTNVVVTTEFLSEITILLAVNQWYCISIYISRWC